MTNLKSQIESILFITGEAIKIDKLAKLTNSSKEEINLVLENLENEYKEKGLRLVKLNDKVQMVTAPENAKIIENIIQSDLKEDLSEAALDTISIIAFRGPLKKAEVDYIRGVNCAFTLRNLLIRGLIERKSDQKNVRAFTYNISLDFLKHLGLTKKEELPNFENFLKIEFPEEKIKID